MDGKSNSFGNGEGGGVWTRLDRRLYDNLSSDP
jgi:hypothetical protein